ncbi:MAG: hypothetical protein FWC96_04140 [Oscillospiraceae bacterium]|nr:hypothetical protein [Oscillospiraceae bacterium]
MSRNLLPYSGKDDKIYFVHSILESGEDVLRLIFVEGVSGVGKTKLTQKLCDKLSEMGYCARCYLEGDFKNPIDFYCTAYFKQHEYENLIAEFPDYLDDIASNTIVAEDVRLVRYYSGETALFDEPLLDILSKHELCINPSNPVPISEFSRVYKLVWEAFAENQNIFPGFLLFDGSLFHHPINDLMGNYNASLDQIIHHVNTLAKSVKLLNPRVVYLSANDVAARLEKARVSRKQTPPSETQIQFWKDRKQTDMEIMRQLSIPYSVYDISNENWDSEIDTMVTRILNKDTDE